MTISFFNDNQRLTVGSHQPNTRPHRAHGFLLYSWISGKKFHVACPSATAGRMFLYGVYFLFDSPFFVQEEYDTNVRRRVVLF